MRTMVCVDPYLGVRETRLALYHHKEASCHCTLKKWLEFYCPARLRNGGRTSGSFSCSPICVRSRILTSSSPRTLAKTSRKPCSSSDSLLFKGCVCSWLTIVPWRSRIRFSRRLYRVSPRPLRFWTRECLTVEYLSSPSKNVSLRKLHFMLVLILSHYLWGSCCTGVGS